MAKQKNPRKFDHLMIDIETMGHESYSAIISIGAVEFDLETGETGKSFYEIVDLASCLAVGLKVNSSTIMWWLQQNADARLEISSKKGLLIAEALLKLKDFINNQSYKVWANSPRFDLGLLQNAYEKINMDYPWDFRNERCVRTILAFDPTIKRIKPLNTIVHNALSDCYSQILWVCENWKIKNKQI